MSEIKYTIHRIYHRSVYTQFPNAVDTQTHVWAKSSKNCAKFWLVNTKMFLKKYPFKPEFTDFKALFCVLWPFRHIFMHTFIGLDILPAQWKALLESLHLYSIKLGSPWNYQWNISVYIMRCGSVFLNYTRFVGPL